VPRELLPDTDLDAAVLTAEKIRLAIADISLPGVDLRVSVSVSARIAAYPADTHPGEPAPPIRQPLDPTLTATNGARR
jgi:hypothetical protein